MGARGPSPTPTAILKLTGSLRASAREDCEAAAPVGEPEIPEYLDAFERADWTQLLGLLSQVPGLLTLVDGETLARYIRLRRRWLAAEKQVAAEGQVIDRETRSGQITVPHPAAKLAAELSAQLLRIEQQFGMTPSARARLAVPGQAKSADPLGDFVRKRNA